MRSHPSPPKAHIGSLVIGTNVNAEADVLEVLQNQVSRFADSYVATVAQAVDDLDPGTTSPEARTEAVRWKLGQATAAFVDASGANPALNVLDLVVLATVSRMVMEDEVSRVFGSSGLPLLEVHRRLETNAWAGLSRVVKPEQQQQLRELILEWRRRNPDQRYVAATRFRELAIAVGKTPQPTASSPNSIFSLLFLDPLAGLDPTAAAIQETRQMAERAMYYTQRMPTLLNWQVQLLTLQVAAQPEIKNILADAERISRSAESFAQVADRLPQLVNDQREAALRQILDGLAAERTNWLVSLGQQDQKGRELLAETRQTLNAASDCSMSLYTTIKTLDAFVRYVSPPNPNQAPAPINQPPFNVLDYGAAARDIGLAANNLNGLLVTLNQSAPGLSRQLTGDAKQTIGRTFWLGVILIFLLMVGLVLAGLAYQVLSQKLSTKSLQLAAGPASPNDKSLHATES